MTSDALMRLLRSLLSFAIGWASAKGYLTPADAGLVMTLASQVGPIIVPIIMTTYSNWGTKSVPNASIAVQATAIDPGASAHEAIVTGKIVGALLFTLLLFGAVPSAFAQNRMPVSPLVALGNSPVVQFFANWGGDDIATAEKLATDFKDDIGAACWQTFSEMGDVIKAHPIPATFKLASDIQAARLFVKAIKKVCLKPECSQMWNDLQNQIGAFTPLPLPISLASICAKIP